MDIRISRKKEYSIIVAEHELRALVNFLSSEYEPIEITAKCSDGSSLTTPQLDDIINFENSNFRKIESLEVNFGKSYSQGGNVGFGGGIYLSTCSFTVKDTDDSKALKVAKEIEQRFEECRPWYSNAGKYVLYGGATVFFIILLLSTGLLFAINTQGKEQEFTSKITFGIFQGLLLGTLFSLVGVYLAKTWFWMFPKIWFDIGKQKAELEKRIKVRNWIFGGIITTLLLGVIASIIATLITNRLTN